MNPILLSASLIAISAFSVFAQGGNILPNPSFEITTEGRPKGWRPFVTPSEATGEFFVADGKEGETVRTGISALQIHFPEAAEVSQVVWLSDPIYGGAPVEPGRYSCAFWVKSEDLRPGFHVWISIVGYAEDKTRVDELERSEYLTSKELPDGAWTRVRFTFEVPESGVTRIAPSLVFKTDPKSTRNTVTPSTRVIVDDLEIVRE